MTRGGVAGARWRSVEGGGGEAAAAENLHAFVVCYAVRCAVWPANARTPCTPASSAPHLQDDVQRGKGHQAQLQSVRCMANTESAGRLSRSSDCTGMASRFAAC